jgi:bacillithiol biosynthesis deacetylase BshB1
MKHDPIDVAVIAPHPDDGELGAGGLLLLCQQRRMRTGIIDLTRGEAGTKGTPEIRAAEARAAGEILGLTARANLDLGDTRLEDSPGNRETLVRVLREWRARVVLSIHPEDPHPDHGAAARLSKSSFHFARFPGFLPGVPAYSPDSFWFYFIHRATDPTLVLDIGEVYARKMEALRAYDSQFVEPKVPENYSYAGYSDYLAAMDTMSRFWGSRVGIERGEAFLASKPLLALDPAQIFAPRTESSHDEKE